MPLSHASRESPTLATTQAVGVTMATTAVDPLEFGQASVPALARSYARACSMSKASKAECSAHATPVAVGGPEAQCCCTSAAK